MWLAALYVAFAFGCVTKVLFFPLGALILVLPGTRQKLRFVAAAKRCW